MRGFLSIEKKEGLWNSITAGIDPRMLLMSAAVGIIAGLLASHVKLHLGISGHKALFWMTPVIVARLLGKCKIGTTSGAFATAFTMLAVGGNIAGGIWGLPLIGLAGVMMDVVIGFVEKYKLPFYLVIPIIGLAGMAANLICFIKRMASPPGVGDHTLFAFSGWWLKPVSYALCGLTAGLAAATIATLVTKKNKESSNLRKQTRLFSRDRS